jgi:hypothetical protein
MKYLAFLFVILATVSPAPSQSSHYDPMPRKPATQSSGFVDSTLGMINPKSTDYGCQVDAERQFFVEQTVKNLDFWVIGITVSLLIVAFLMLLHQNRERDRREIIAAGFLAHNYNAWIDARSHADSAIRRHNELVKRTNAAAESALRTASEEAGKTHTKPEQSGSSGATESSTQQPAIPKDGARVTENRDSRSNSSRQTDEVEIDSVAQISVLQKQLEASRERETNLKKQLAAAERRYRRLESNDTAVPG